MIEYLHRGKDGVERVRQMPEPPMTLDLKLVAVRTEAARRIEQIEGPPGPYRSRGWRMERARDQEEAGQNNRVRKLRMARHEVRARANEVEAAVQALEGDDAALAAFDIIAAFDA